MKINRAAGTAARIFASASSIDLLTSAAESEGSKIALAALVAFCRANAITMIDCQQNTAHLASLGAAQMPRPEFISRVKQRLTIQAPIWQFEPLHWHQILTVQP